MDEFHALTAERLDDLEALFDSDAITRDCSCMWWRQSAREWKAGTAAKRRRGFRKVVAGGPPPGILAYRDGRAVGWVQVTPRVDIPRFNGPRASGRPADPATDLQTTWALSCFFLHHSARGAGLMVPLAEAACRYAAAHGARAVEAAALAPQGPLMWGDGFTGIVSALERAGFVAEEQRTKLRWLMRWTPD